MLKSMLGLLIIFVLLSLSACSSSNASASTKSHPVKHQHNGQMQNQGNHQVNGNESSNVELKQDPETENVIRKFYKYLNEGNYLAATSLLGPRLKFEGSTKFIKYLKNIKNTKVIKIKDISNDPGQINDTYRKYKKVKVYYVELKMSVEDPNLVKGLEGMNYRRFILVKKQGSDNWLIDLRESTNKR